jgi:hypothetical protein
VCKTRTYFLPESKTVTTAQLKKNLPANAQQVFCLNGWKLGLLLWYSRVW